MSIACSKVLTYDYTKGKTDMSYSFNNPCSNCKKSKIEVNGVVNEKPCKDAQKIQEAVSLIHSSNDGSHQGGGEILMMCCRVDALS
jgi:hypothetical protein